MQSPQASTKNTHLPYILLIIFIALHAALTLTLSLTLRNEFKTSGLDGMAFAQAFYNVIHGDGFAITIHGFHQPWLGIHFSPILYALVPLYAAFPYVETLLLVHSIFIALAAWPIFLAAHYLLQSRKQALLTALVYLANPYVIHAAIWDFHEIAFAPLIIAFMMWAIVCKKPIHLVVFSLLLLTVKEHYGLAVFGSGVLWAWRWHDIRFGALLSAFGLAAMAFIVLYVMPHYSANNTLYWSDASQAGEMNRYSWIHDAFKNTDITIYIAKNALIYGAYLLALFWFLPLAAPLWLLPGLADMAANMLSANLMMRSVYSYHSAALQPVFAVASIVCLVKFSEKKIAFARKITLKPADILVTMLVTACIMSYVLLAVKNLWGFEAPHPQMQSQDRSALDAIEHIIPENAMLAAQSNVLPHLKIGRQFSVFPYGTKNTQYIVLRVDYPYQTPIDYFNTLYGLQPEIYFEAVKAVFQDREWHVIFYDNKWVVFGKTEIENADARLKALQTLTTTQARYEGMLPQFILEHTP